MQTRINKKLNLVIPVDTENKGTVYVHSTPLSREVFETHFMIISRTFSEIYRQRLDVLAGPRVAMMLLRRIASDQGVLDGPDGIENGLIAEMRRITNVVMPTDKGWETYPLQDAMSRELLSRDDLDEVEGVVCFFIVNSAMHRRDALPEVLNLMASLWDAQITSLGCMEYVNTLPKSIAEPASPTITSSVPS